MDALLVTPFICLHASGFVLSIPKGYMILHFSFWFQWPVTSIERQLWSGKTQTGEVQMTGCNDCDFNIQLSDDRFASMFWSQSTYVPTVTMTEYWL